MNKKEFKNIKILYVEDEDNIRENAVFYLKRLFDIVFEAKDAFEALEIIEQKNPHIIITDINMPKLNGLELIKNIRKKDSKIAIIVLSAYTKTDYLLEAIELGLEKYLVKPIRHETIYPVLINCVKKIKGFDLNLNHFFDNYLFNSLNKQLFKNGIEIKLTHKEIDFLTLLCQKKNQIVPYEIIQSVVWNDDFMSEDAIRSVARNLRKKLPENCLENVSKIGYKIITLD